MKKIRWIELLAEIKANLVAFVSISMFVALGIGLFLGIQWGGVALGGAANKALEEATMHDIEVSFPYGLTNNDLNKLKALDSVSDVETAYTSFSTLKSGVSRYVTKFQSITERIDVLYNMEGKLPTKKNEVVMLRSTANNLGVKVGDSITFVHDATSEDDTDGMEYLYTDTFKVTGLADHPAYMSTVTGTLGSANIGTGDVECVVFVDNVVFDVDKFQNGYPNVFVRCDELRGMSTFSSEYQDKLNGIVDEVAKLGGKLGTTRYNELHDEAQQKIDDAQFKVDDGAKQIEDGANKIADGEQEIADGQKTLDDAEGQLADGKQQLDSGKQQLDDGRSQLSSARQSAESAKQDAASKLASAKKDLDDGQAAYDTAKSEFDKATGTYKTVEGNYNAAVAAYNNLEGQKANGQPQGAESALEAAIDEYQNATSEYNSATESLASVKDADPSTFGNEEDTPEVKQAAKDAAVEDAEKRVKNANAQVDAAKGQVDSTYAAFASEYGNSQANYKSFTDNAGTVIGAYGVKVPVEEGLPDPTPPDEGKTNLDAVRDQAQNCVSTLNSRLGTIESVMNYTVTYNGKNYSLLEIPTAISNVEAELNSAKQELDSNWAKYYAARAEFEQKTAEAEAQLNDAQALLDQKQAEYDAAKALYEQKLAEFNSGKQKLADARRELEEARKRLEQAREELAEAKRKLADAKDKFAEMKKYEWFVFPRLENGAAQSVQTMTDIQGKMRWAMALLFVLVGLFVCYSAVSRLVNDEVTQIGTKKAVGFREGEIGSLYYWFSGISVAVGAILAALIAVFVVETIMNPVAAESLVLEPFAPHFDLVELLIGSAIELALILLSTWIAVHGILKRNAVDLLSGETKASSAKAHFWEKWKLWKKMSLFSQTVVNNCVNDTRRVVATLIGVTGVTALIVTAVTLSNNVAKSYDLHYEEVYGFDTVVYMDTKQDEAKESVTKALNKMGVQYATTHLERLQVRQPSGYRGGVSLYVPDDNKKFTELFHVLDLDTKQQVDLNSEGVYISDTYAEHMHLHAGDEVTVTEATGQAHTFKVAGVFECYILRNEFVLSKKEYKKAFGTDPQINAVLVNRGDVELDKMRETLLKTKGFSAISDDKSICGWAFDELAKLLDIVVLIYLILSALMAVLVLLNLDVMFVEEKKRELIVLMICGFSVKDAKAYIYRDSIALTIIGILLGVLLGATMGGITVAALEPDYGYFLTGFNWFAVLIGVVASAVFSIAVLLWALRRIPRFDLTDINRF